MSPSGTRESSVSSLVLLSSLVSPTMLWRPPTTQCLSTSFGTDLCQREVAGPLEAQLVLREDHALHGTEVEVLESLPCPSVAPPRVQALHGLEELWRPSTRLITLSATIDHGACA